MLPVLSDPLARVMDVPLASERKSRRLYDERPDQDRWLSADVKIYIRRLRTRTILHGGIEYEQVCPLVGLSNQSRRD